MTCFVERTENKDGNLIGSHIHNDEKIQQRSGRKNLP
jgi:hypothetical protein